MWSCWPPTDDTPSSTTRSSMMRLRKRLRLEPPPWDERAHHGTSVAIGPVRLLIDADGRPHVSPVVQNLGVFNGHAHAAIAGRRAEIVAPVDSVESVVAQERHHPRDMGNVIVRT